MPRLFIALYPPPETALALLGELDGLELPPGRASSVDQLHMTLLFIGDAPERDVPAIAESAERAAAGVGPFELAPQRLVTLPEHGLARLVAAVTHAPGALLELRRRLVSRLVTRREKSGPFLPHLTLHRFRSPARFELAPRPLATPPFLVDSISLRSSVLRPEGAEHRQIARVELAAR